MANLFLTAAPGQDIQARALKALEDLKRDRPDVYAQALQELIDDPNSAWSRCAVCHEADTGLVHLFPGGETVHADCRHDR